MGKRNRSEFNNNGYEPDSDCNSDTEICELNIIMNKIKEEKNLSKKFKKELNSIELNLSDMKIK